MLTENLELPPQAAPPWKRIAIGIFTVLLLIIFGLVYDETDGFARGQLSDLCQADAKVIDEIKKHDIRVANLGAQCNHFDRKVMVKVRWDSGRREYRVRSLQIRSVAVFNQIEPFVRQFTGLRGIELPDASLLERQRVAEQYPEYAVSRGR